jgi:hypothetical protein
VIPEREKIGTEDIASWHARPHPDNTDGNEVGAWLITAGDCGDDVWLEVLHTEYPKQVAEFIVEAVQSHATRLRLSAAFEDVYRERERRRARPTGADLYEMDRGRVVAMMTQLGQLAAEAYEPAPPAEADAQARRVYDGVTHLAAMAVCWLEAIHARYGVGGPGLPDAERQAS